jgi:hypothetical protein
MLLHKIIACITVADRIDRTVRTLECDILSCIYNKYHIYTEFDDYNLAATVNSPIACRIIDINVNTQGETFDFAVIPSILSPTVCHVLFL